jgi:tRNA (guanine-N7-)-methyltransferase
MSDSLPVLSNQTGPHDDLSATVSKHLHTTFKRPVPAWVDELAQSIVQTAGHRPLILDSGCGTGHSTVHIAMENPNAWVVGIDQSADRLRRSPNDIEADNLQFVRADAQDLWRALQNRGVKLHAHYLLYPNPWPKAHHLMRRWHAHPVWPSLLALGGTVELRTNWEIYAREFHQALMMSGAASITMDTLSNSDALAHPVSLFEKKYAASGHTLWRVRATVL